MFINPTVFKKLIRKAWGMEGLTIGHKGDDIFLAGGWWVIRADKNALTNKVKAAVIEIAGGFPERGEVFTCHKKEDAQYELAENGYWDIRERFQDAETELRVSRVSIHSDMRDIRIMKDERTGTCVAVNEIFMDLVDYGVLEEGEEPPEGPRTDRPQAGMVYWANGRMAAAVCRIERDGKLEELLARLDGILLPFKGV